MLNQDECRNLYKDQLPKITKLTGKHIFRLFLNVCTIAGAVYIFFKTPPSEPTLRLVLIIIIVALVIYIIYTEKKRLTKYAYISFYYHYLNHIFRDKISEFLLMDEESQPDSFQINNFLQEVVDSIANCFSTITNHVSRVCIKTIDLNNSNSIALTTSFRDSISKSNTQIKSLDSKTIHKLEGNTDFELLWYALNGRTRFYLANNLPKEYKKRKYNNTSFENLYGSEPTIGTLFVKNWRLPYKSTLVVPIRHVINFTPPSRENEGYIDKGWKYKGFLCIDTPNKYSFNTTIDPEIAAAFADQIYMFLELVEKIDQSRSSIKLLKEELNDLKCEVKS